MRLFPRPRKQENKATGNDRLAGSIATYILKIQTRFANFMDSRTRGLSTARLKFLLIVFLVGGSSLSIYIVIDVIQKKSTSNTVQIGRLQVPRYYRETGDAYNRSSFLITKREHEAMQAFKRRMDSLASTEEGKLIYDSIMLCRPGLMDSVGRFEQLYQQQIKNKK